MGFTLGQQICKVEEIKGHVHYAVRLGVSQGEDGCSFQCNPHKLMSDVVPHIIIDVPSDDGKICSCFAPDGISREGHDRHLFDYRINPSLEQNEVCSPQNC